MGNKYLDLQEWLAAVEFFWRLTPADVKTPDPFTLSFEVDGHMIAYWDREGKFGFVSWV